MNRIRAVVFDAYGTLLDIHGAMARYADRLGPDWRRISAAWRSKQVEYTWVRSLAGPGSHRGFWRLTEESLAWTAARHRLTDPSLLADILLAYRHLDPFPEVPVVLRHLRDRGLPRAVLSNAAPDMLHEAVRHAGLTHLLDAVLSAEEAGVFKPDPRVYRMAGHHFGLAGSQMAFVSANPWDAFGAQAFGLRVFWLNREGAPREYDLGATVTEIADLSALPALLAP